MIVNTIDEYELWFLVNIMGLYKPTYNWGITLQEQGLKVYEPFIMRI